MSKEKWSETIGTSWQIFASVFGFLFGNCMSRMWKFAGYLYAVLNTGHFCQLAQRWAIILSSNGTCLKNLEILKSISDQFTLVIQMPFSLSFFLLFVKQWLSQVLQYFRSLLCLTTRSCSILETSLTVASQYYLLEKIQRIEIFWKLLVLSTSSSVILLFISDLNYQWVVCQKKEDLINGWSVCPLRSVHCITFRPPHLELHAPLIMPGQRGADCRWHEDPHRTVGWLDFSAIFYLPSFVSWQPVTAMCSLGMELSHFPYAAYHPNHGRTL